MKKSHIAIIGFILLLASIQGAFCAPQTAGSDGSAAEITVMGEGTVSVPADTVTVSIGVETNNANSTLARTENDLKLNQTIKALAGVGVSQSDVLPGLSSSASSAQSSVRICNTVNNTTVCKESTSSDSNMIGNSVLVRADASDPSRISSILETARASGAMASVVGYGLNNEAPVMAQARKVAVENARTSAEEMAAAAGVKLGKVLDISDYPGSEVGPARYGAAAASSKSGMVDVTAYVTVTYEISQ
ncbi:MAG TPA: SIMPL domain-containing protein [Methanotrichaceae archaeon]|nr:SIMPL domain-containing protein [Methanotrichaceae archaeon]